MAVNVRGLMCSWTSRDEMGVLSNDNDIKVGKAKVLGIESRGCLLGEV